MAEARADIVSELTKILQLCKEALDPRVRDPGPSEPLLTSVRGLKAAVEVLPALLRSMFSPFSYIC